MKTKNKIILLFFLLAMNQKTSSNGLLHCISQTSVTERLIDFQISNADPIIALEKLSLEAPVKIGLEIHCGENSNPSDLKVTISAKSKKISSILDHIVNKMPGYTWTLNDNIINIRALEIKDNFLDVNITKINLKNISSRELIDSLLKIPDVQNQVLRNKMQRRVYISIIGNFSESKTLSLRFKKGSLRDALNKTLLENDLNFWIYVRWKREELDFFNIYIK